MGKIFISPEGKRVECERETKILTLVSVNNTDYYKGKNHDRFKFIDTDKNIYLYDATLNADMTEYDAKFASELAFSDGKQIKLTAYFVPPSSHYDSYYIYNPRLLEILD